MWIDKIRFDAEGLVPVVAQEASTGEVLMLAYANRRALELTARTGEAHYWSRSRGELWRKGESSGHTQEVVDVRVDCDADSVLYRVRQNGPACHTLERSCFHRVAGAGGDLAAAGDARHILSRLEDIVRLRDRDRPDGSYTTYLFEAGLDKILKKVGEESAEIIIAAKNREPEELAGEAADLFYHVLVLLREQQMPLERVWSILDGRFGGELRGSQDSASSQRQDRA